MIFRQLFDPISSTYTYLLGSGAGGEAEYVEIMHNLNLPNPKLMDIAIPANLACGRRKAPPQT